MDGKLFEALVINFLIGQPLANSVQVENSKVDGGQVENVCATTD